jgi:hypothetical protein
MEWKKYSSELRKLKFSDYRYDYLLDKMKYDDDPFSNLLMSTHSDNIRDEYRNKHYNRFSNMKKLSRYNTYEFVNDGEGLTVKSYKHNMRGRSVKDLIRKCYDSDEFLKLGLPLPVNKDSHLLGILKGKPRRSSSRKRIYEKDLLIEEFNSLTDNDYIENDFQNIQTHNGDWKHNSQNLIDMATVKEHCYHEYEIMNGILSRVGIDFKLPYIGNFHEQFILGLDVKPKAYPGLSTSMKIAKFRKDSSRYTKDYAYKYAKRIMKNERQILDTSLNVIGGREKRVKFNSDEKGKKVKTRVTCMGEDVPTLISQSLVNPITNCIPEIGDHFSQLAKVYGQGNLARYKEVMQPRDWKELVCDLDYSGHDNNTSEAQIVVAFAFLRLCYKESREIDRLFFYSMSSMIYKRLVLPETNMVYRICKGVSTGHGFTSLITTLCAYATLATGLYRITNHYESDIKHELLSTTRIGNAGDDCNIRQSCELMVPLYEDIIRYSGHTIDNIRDNGYINSNNPTSRVTFLKKQFYDFSWNERELFTNLVHPTVAERNFGHRADNLKVLMYQSPLNFKLNNKIICLIVSYILSAKGYKHYDMIRAKLDNRILHPFDFMRKCKQIGFSNPNFIAELLKLDYGSFVTHGGVLYKDKVLGYVSMFSKSSILLDSFIKDELRKIELTIPRKISWFTTKVRYKMHRTKNTLTVYDFMKIYTKPKSNNISFHGLRLYYQKLQMTITKM